MNRLVEAGCGWVFLTIWRILGMLACPLLLLLPAARRHILQLPAPQPGWTWLHGASAGEHVAARALAPHIGRCWSTSSSWRTPVPNAFPAPLDLPFLVGRWLDRARPGRLILIEGELWPGWLIACRARDIPVAVVNARSGRGLSRWQRTGPIWRWLTRDVVWIPQSDTGDLKLAGPAPDGGLTLKRPALIAACTRPGDEAHVLMAWDSLPTPRPLLVLAPRHLERIAEVASLLQQRSWCLRSDGVNKEADIVLLDTMGELSGLYGQASAVFVGGTFDPAIGGHSPAEAMQAGVPIVRGPHFHANPEAWTHANAIEALKASELTTAFQTALAENRRAPVHSDAATATASRLPHTNVPPERTARPWLFPLSSMWAMLSFLHRKSQRPACAMPVRTIVVGGLVNGGAGRTPTAGWIAQNIDGAWVVSAGYQRGSGSDVRIGRPGQTPPAFLGDELEMLRRQGIPVVSAPDRIAGVSATEDARVAIIDGGLGHPTLANAFRICCIDALSPTGRGPFPMGAARYPWSLLKEMDTIWLHNHHPELPMPALPPGVPVVRSTLDAVGWIHKGQIQPLDAIQGAVDVVVGIAKPERFRCALLQLGLQVRSFRTVSDHGDLGRLAPGTVVSEKDAARLPADSDVWALKMGLRVDGAEPVLAAIMGSAP